MKKVRVQRTVEVRADSRRWATLSPAAKAAISGIAIQVLANAVTHLLFR